jgi:hypothetical protein
MPIVSLSKPQPPWRFVYYITEAGACEVFDFLEELRDGDFASFTYFHENILKPLLANGPHSLPKPLWEDLGDGFSDVSWGRHRIYCCIERPRRVFALVPIAEKRFPSFQSMRGRLVRKCERRRADIQSGNYDEATRYAEFNNHRERRGKPRA